MTNKTSVHQIDKITISTSGINDVVINFPCADVTLTQQDALAVAHGIQEVLRPEKQHYPLMYRLGIGKFELGQILVIVGIFTYMYWNL